MSFAERALLLLFLPVLAVSGSQPRDAVRRADTGEEKLIALTFDDGPDPDGTGAILDVLSEYGVRATFFVIGEKAEKSPDLLIRAVGEGHEIGNHTYSHLNGKKTNAKRYLADVKKNGALLSGILGYETVLFRPPGGNLSAENGKAIAEAGCVTVLWSVDTEDWKGIAADKIVSAVLGHVRGGDIVLMHDCIYGKGHTAEALKTVLPALIAEGYRFVTVSELLSADVNRTAAQ